MGEPAAASVTMAEKKGFMTPERKKKLRTLLRKKAAEELKKEQERKAEERLRVIAERCGTKAEFESASIDDLKKICQTYFDKWYGLEGEMFFLQKEVEFRDYRINELNIAVNDLRGKFIKPTLKKVSKYENKFAKLQKKAAEFNFRNQLKTVKKKEFSMDDEEQKKKPDWVLGAKDAEKDSPQENGSQPEEATEETSPPEEETPQETPQEIPQETESVEQAEVEAAA